MENKVLSFWARNELWIAIAILVVLIPVPLLISSPYIMSILTLSLVYISLVLSLNLVTGFLGITSLGHIAFFGVGAYVAAIMSTRFEMNFLVTILFAMIVTAVFGLLIGAPTLRIGGRYLAIVTLGFCEITRILEINLVDLTGGPYGIRSIPAPQLFGFKFSGFTSIFYVCLLFAVIIIIFMSRIINSRVGRGILAVKGDEIAANSTGINTVTLKLMVFVVSAAIAGAVGAVYAHYLTYIDPTMFTADKSTLILSMLILGGIGSIHGSVVGAVVLTIIPELLRGIPGMLIVRQVAYGIILIVMVVFKPNGLLGGFNLRHIRQRDELEKTSEVVDNGE